MGKKAVYYICNEPNWGYVAQNVWEILGQEGLLGESAGILFDGREVKKHTDADGNEFYFVPTAIAICRDYNKYLPEMNKYFADADISGMVTWHEGAHALPNVLTVHSLGDVDSGVYAPTKPRLMRNLMKAIDANRVKLGLDEYTTVTEATHWSGVHGGEGDAKLLLNYPVPMMDIEVGSDEGSWNNMTACRALALSLTQIFKDDGKRVHNILCLGGVHFDPNYAEAVFTEWGDEAFGVTHIIANQWLVTGEYENELGLERASACIDSIEGGVEAIVFHDKAKGCYKDLARSLAKKYDIPAFKHQRLRDPQSLGL